MVIRHDNDDGTVKGESTLYQHHDNLGSANVITGLNAAGKSVIIERQHYGAFGEPLKANSLERSQSNSDTSPSGYTGHEMLNGFGLVHMNARLFDPVLGRFLSPDTFVQTMSNPQALNRYSYVLNNPVNYTDPTGHFFSSLLATWALYESYHWVKDHPEEALMIAVTAIAASVTGGMGMAAWQSGMITGAIAGGYGAQQAGRSMGDIAIAAFVGGVQGGLTAGAFKTVGDYSHMKGLNSYQQTALHGLTGGGLGFATGGGNKGFKNGFVSAAVSKGFGEAGGYQALGNNKLSNAVAAGVVGGTASELTGGDFANGARTATFQKKQLSLPVIPHP